MDCDVVVVGAGPAGLLAASRAAERGRRTLLLEKNPKAGVKILMSGGTRCNLTHDTDARGIVAAFGPPGRFLHSALRRLGPRDVRDLFAAEGVATKVEPGGKVFPASDRATDVQAALLARIARSGATLVCGEPLRDLRRQTSGFRLTTSRRTLTAGNVVLTTGGMSYPSCGTTGDGYRWAAELGHTIVAPRVALVPVTTDAAWVRQLQGITVADALIRLMPAESRVAPDAAAPANVVLAEQRGAVLLTHFGLSGPAILDVSRVVSDCPRGRRPLLACDFVPSLAATELDAALVGAAGENGRRQVAHVLARWIPHRLAESLARQVGVASEQPLSELRRECRLRLVGAMKRTVIPLSGTLGFEKAEVTAGGICLDEIDSRTMQSKRVPGLFAAGELLDLDGPIGGYNFQAAFSTGYLAGEIA